MDHHKIHLRRFRPYTALTVSGQAVLNRFPTSITGEMQLTHSNTFSIFRMGLRDPRRCTVCTDVPVENTPYPQNSRVLLRHLCCSSPFLTNDTSCLTDFFFLPHTGSKRQQQSLAGDYFLLQHRSAAFNSKPSIIIAHDRKTCSTGSDQLILTLPSVISFLLPPKPFKIIFSWNLYAAYLVQS